MSTTDEVIGSIDQTLRDYGTSDDAMRWTPQPAPPRPAALPQLRPPSFARVVIRIDTAPFVAAMRSITKAAGQIGKMLAKYGHALGNPSHNVVRCRRCRPYANPVRLSHGVAYRARVRRRTRSHR